MFSAEALHLELQVSVGKRLLVAGRNSTSLHYHTTTEIQDESALSLRA